MSSAHVLVVGGGFGGLDVAVAVKRRRPDTPVTLVNPSAHLTYRPWLIYLPAGERQPTDLRVPLAGLSRFGITLLVDSVTTLDPQGTTRLASGEHVSFTHAVVATGAHSDPGLFPGSADHAFFPCDTAEATRFTEAFRRLEKGQVTVVIAGERPGPGLEYAGWLVRALEREAGRRAIGVRVVDAEGRLAAVLGPRALSRVTDHFTSRGHEFVTGATVLKIGPDGIRLAGGQILGSDLTAVVGPLRGHDLGLPPEALDGRGFVRVDRNLRSPLHPTLFAVGDAAAVPEGLTLPKSMIMARSQAKTVADNVLRSLDGVDPKPFDFDKARRSVVAMPDFGGRTVFVKNQKLIMSGRLPLVLRSLIDKSFFRTHDYGTEEGP